MIVDIYDEENLKIAFESSQKISDLVKTLPSREFMRKEGVWKFPVIDYFILKKIFKENGLELSITERARQKYVDLIASFKRVKDLADQTDVEHIVLGLKEGMALYPFQKVGSKFLDVVGSGLLGMDMGLGKAGSIDSKLLTPNGWIRMGDVKIGDEVFGSDGKSHAVINIFPQGLKDCYEVEFTDGSLTECTDNHLWNIQSPSQKWKGRKYKTVELKDFKNDLRDKHDNTKWFIPMVQPIQFNEKKVPVDPYLLGALLGDGSLGSKNAIGFTTADCFMAAEMNALLPSNVILRKKKSKYEYSIVAKVRGKTNPMVGIVRNLNLNVLSSQKHIPDIYKFSSIEHRIAMLQGLMDTDGGVDSSDGIVISYTSVSEKLADDVRFLVESLGGVAIKSSRIPTFTYLGIKKKGQKAYRLNISLPTNIKPFRLPRKSEAYTPRTKYQPYRGVESVKYIGKKECQCIYVDVADHLYVTDHCILTHNTPTSISHVSNKIQTSKEALRILVICPASLKYEWAYQIAKFTDYSYTVIGSGKERLPQYDKKTNFTIMNYDLVWRDIEILQKAQWDVVICDEIQRIKNYATVTFKAIETLNVTKRIGLTGTPLENDVMDLFTIMKFINPKIFGTDETTFKYRYCQTNSFNQIVPGKYRNLDELVKKLSFIMFRRRKRDVLSDLPERITNHFYIDLNKEERDKYNEIKSGILEDIEKGTIKKVHALAMMTYLRQACDALNLVITKDKIASSKFEELKSIIKGFPEDEKIVLFTQYKKMGDLIAANIGYKSVHLNGDVKNDCKREREIEKEIAKANKGADQRKIDIKTHEAKQEQAQCVNCPYYNNAEKCSTRKKLMAQFNDPEQNVKMFISTDAGKAGLNLQTAGVVINYDLSFNPATNEQRISRIERMGQLREKIFVLNLLCRDTVEERVEKAIQRKQRLFDRVIDNLSEGEVERLVLNFNNIKDLL